MSKVILSNDLYVEVGQDSFDLYYKDPQKKTPKALGYFTRVEVLVKKATQFLLSKKENPMTMTQFLREWARVQAELTDYLTKYKIDEQ